MARSLDTFQDRFQPSREDGAAAPPLLRPIRVLGIAGLRSVLTAARATGLPAAVITAPEAAAFAGAGWFKALIAMGRDEFPDVPTIAILDCGDMAGLVLGAWRAGVPDVLFTGPAESRDRLRAAGAQVGGRLHDRVAAILDLDHVADPDAACRNWLITGSG